MEQRICLRYLLRDMIALDSSKQAELEKIKNYREAIKQTDRVKDTEYEARLAVCRTCEKLIDGTCLACGCYVELRAAVRMSHCPKKKW